MRVSEIYETVDVPTVLYHATTIDRVDTILRDGLIPQVGRLTSQYYHENEPCELVYAASDKNREKFLSVLAHQIGYKFGKYMGKVTRADIISHGAIGVIQTDAYKFQRATGRGKPYSSLERGDYYATEPVQVDRFLVGNDLVAFLRRQLTKAPAEEPRIMGIDY